MLDPRRRRDAGLLHELLTPDERRTDMNLRTWSTLLTLACVPASNLVLARQPNR